MILEILDNMYKRVDTITPAQQQDFAMFALLGVQVRAASCYSTSLTPFSLSSIIIIWRKPSYVRVSLNTWRIINIL